MDSVLKRLVEFSADLRYEDLGGDVVHACKQRVTDYVGCGLGGYDSTPSAVARSMAMRVTVLTGSRVIGTARRTLPELATFANGVAARYLDGNDNFPSGGHPSDTISALMAVADYSRKDGKSLILSVAHAYEIYYCMYQSLKLRDKGYDYVLYTAAASAAGAARLLGLDAEQSGHAISLAITPNLALGVTRRGHLSMWKGCAGGNAARNGVFAAILASEGLTGPEHPFEGSHGLWELVDEHAMSPLAGSSAELKVLQACTKNFLTEYHSQLPVELALQLYNEKEVKDIQSIRIHTYWFTFSEIGNEPEKWHPTTRETADHSLPFIIAAVLLDGRFSDEIFSDQRLQDQRIHDLADKISIFEDLEFSKRAPKELPCRIEIQLKDGSVRSAQGTYPVGHCKKPMTDQQIEEKFAGLAGRALKAQRVSRVLGELGRLESITNYDQLYDSLIVEQ